MNDRDRPSSRAHGAPPRSAEPAERHAAAADPRRTLTGVLALRRDLEAQLRAERERASAAQARCRDAEAAASRALQSFEERRIVAAELRTMLDATEYRITTLEAEVHARESELRVLAERHAAEIVELAERHDAVEQALVDAARERARERESWLAERDAIAERGARIDEEQRTLRAAVAERSAECATLAEQLRAAVDATAELRGRLDETTALVEEAFAESAELRGLAEALQREVEAERHGGAASRAERDDLTGRLAAALADLGAAAARIDELQLVLEEQRALHEDGERRRQAAEDLGRSKDALITEMTAALAALGDESERRAEALEELDRAREAQLAEREAMLAALGEEGERRAAALTEAARRRQARVEELEAALEALREEAARHDRTLAEDIGTRQARIGELEGALESLREESDRRGRTLAESARSKDIRIEELEASLSALRQESERRAEWLAEAAREKEARLSELERRLAERSAESDRRGKELADLAREKEARVGELEAAVATLREESERRGEALADLDRQKGARVEELETTLAALREDADRRAEGLAQLGREREARIGELEAILGSAREENASLGEALARLTRENESRTAELEGALAALGEERERLARGLADTGAELTAVRGERGRAGAELEQARSNLEGLRARHEELSAELAAARDAEQAQSADLERRNREIERLTVEMRGVVESAARLEGQMLDLQQRNARMVEEREGLVEMTARSERLLSEARERAEARERGFARQLEGQATALAEAGAERERLVEEARRLGEERDAIAAGLEAARVELEAARRESENRRLADDEAELRAGALEEEIRTLRAEGLRLDGVGSDLWRALEAATIECEAARGQLEEARRRQEIERERADAERAEAAERAARLTRALESAEEAAAAAALERDAIGQRDSGEREELERRCAASAREYAELAELLTVASRELEETQRTARARLAEKDAALDALGAERDDLRGGLEKAEAARCQAEEELAQLREVAARHDEEVRALRAALERELSDAARARDARAELHGEREGLQREMLLWREQAEVARTEVATLVAQLAELSTGPSGPELEMRVCELEQAAQLGRLRESALQTAVNDMQEQLLREQAHAASLWGDLESQAHFREALDSALAEARSRCSQLEEALQRELQRSASDAAGPQEPEASARVQELEARLAEVEAERAAMNEQAESLRSLVEGLERECEQLRRRGATPDDRLPPRGEIARLQSRIEELERQQRDAVQRHTTAVNGYMLELNQRTETLRQRDLEINRLTEEIGVLQATCDDAVSQLTEVRNERDLPQHRGSPRGAPARAEPPGGAAQTREGSAEAKRERDELRIAETKSAGEEKKRPAVTPVTRRVARPMGGGPVTVILVEDDASCQEIVRAAVANLPDVHCVLPQHVDKAPPGRRILAVNMLSRTADPVAMIAESAKLGIDDPSAFTYFAYSGRGFSLGMVDFFPHPFEPDACASRLLGRPGGLQRLLAVSEDVDLMSGIREVLGRVRCSAATAFDARQALDLVPMIKPEVVLVDLALPRGEALRIVSRLRTDPKTASVAVAMLWTTPITGKDVAQSALRVVRDFALSHEEVARSLERVLTDEDLGLMTGDAIRDAG